MTLSNDFTEYQAKLAEVDRLAAVAAPGNRQALFDALAAAGVHTVVLHYDGEGDEGQMDHPEAFAGENLSMDMPALEIQFTEIMWDEPMVRTQPRTVRDVVKTMAWDFLGRTHRGWEINEGGFGTFTFNAAARTITLDHAECFVQHEYHHHEL